MSNYGLVIAREGGTIQPGEEPDFDSRRKHLLVDLNASPKHFDIVALTGTALSISAGGSASETLLTIPHKLPYIPKVETYIYIDDESGFNFQTGSGSYFRTFYPYSGSLGSVSDLVQGSADATNYYIKHTLSGATAYTSDANTKPVKVKYFIFSNLAL